MSNTQKKNVPELRFPGFEDEWEEKKVGELLEFKNGLNKGKEYFGSGSSIVNFKDVFNNRSLNTNNLTGKVNVNSKELKNYSVEKGDVFFTRTSEVIGEIGYPSVILNDPENTVFSGFVLRGRPKSGIDLINNNFKRYVFFTNSFRKEMITKSSMTTRALTSGTAINKMKIIYPVSAKEQKKIGDFFSKLDRQIELQEQKLELLQQEKKGYMQKIFSQELRFKDENGEDYPDWKEKKLGDITEQSMYGIGASATRFDSKNIYIRITDIDEKSRKLNYQNLTTPDELNNKYKLKRNDILFARTGASTGKSYIHKEEKDIYNYYFAGFLIKFEIDEQNNPLFIYQFTLTSKFNKWVKVMSVRSGQPGINSEEYAKLPLVLPNKLEQQKIAEFLDRFDQQIELEKQKIEILQQQKKGLLQSMFI
ncbi:TPA: restriction endonuclease subunit S [Staphylococcus aureus]|uniref:restriction endonuclease subunit S n=2 Tax=Staphylococcus aureus TaxID=1280 RepID=UPI000DFC205F|nr:restriction endonuclease subunit S [Staphylococcus aureus]SUK11890.1 restriction-modification enzyme type I, specificity subunit [Staphylococcus aureus]SUK14967.1 restriction-modification enzyme type I, specificity subunit [Staphylococcus aureus]HDD0210872.1 restriction endonuclease subunit S [Staphylococcus aureus]HDD0306008.1 restriction endonuclease subunit S [Staphylococcus aureus]HDD0323056.1 restriction endonuclease subunit S [Staphylococcus aureus]